MHLVCVVGDCVCVLHRARAQEGEVVTKNDVFLCYDNSTEDSDCE